MSASSLNVILLAAGMGKRLSGGDAGFPPKCLLRFDGMSLLERHLEILGFGDLISSVTIVVGYQSDSIKNEVANSNRTSTSISFRMIVLIGAATSPYGMRWTYSNAANRCYSWTLTCFTHRLCSTR